MEGGKTVVVQGESHQRSLAIRTEDTGHVSKSRSLRQNGSLRRPLFHYSPPGRWTMSISQR